MVEGIGIEPMLNTGLQPVALPAELTLHVTAPYGAVNYVDFLVLRYINDTAIISAMLSNSC